jgi:hypothetical protein
LKNILKIKLFQKSGFPAACLDSLQQCPGTSYRKFVSPTCPDSPTNTSYRKVLSPTCLDRPADASFKKSLSARYLDTEVKTVDREDFPCTCSDTRATCLDTLQQNIHLLIHVRTRDDLFGHHRLEIYS